MLRLGWLKEASLLAESSASFCDKPIAGQTCTYNCSGILDVKVQVVVSVP